MKIVLRSCRLRRGVALCDRPGAWVVSPGSLESNPLTLVMQTTGSPGKTVVRLAWRPRPSEVRLQLPHSRGFHRATAVHPEPAASAEIAKGGSAGVFGVANCRGEDAASSPNSEGAWINGSSAWRAPRTCDWD